MRKLNFFTKNIFFALIFLFFPCFAGISVFAQNVEISDEPEVSFSEEIDVSSDEKSADVMSGETLIPTDSEKAEDSALSENSETADVSAETDEYGGDIASIQVEIPSEMRPRQPDPEKLKEIQQKDEDGSE